MFGLPALLNKRQRVSPCGPHVGIAIRLDFYANVAIVLIIFVNKGGMVAKRTTCDVASMLTLSWKHPPSLSAKSVLYSIQQRVASHAPHTQKPCSSLEWSMTVPSALPPSGIV